MIQRFIQVLVVVSLFCLPMSSSASKIETKNTIITDISSINNCKFLYDIRAKSGYSKQNNWRRHTIHKAQLKVEELGGTHLVISQVERTGVYNGVVKGKAYQCRKI